MNEIEERYKKFALDENMREKFSQSSVEVQEKYSMDTSLVITTVVIGNSGKTTTIKEADDAKLV
ncbi:hypothetical protein JWG42_17240 [Desulfoprunum benzoelyticum]|uniref:Uncharacterized protein n=1 Tax=Desulfoprunum benzoelyticum TaxID=1506996 RepID=A0A840UVM6_9BACT|nr:hypothetical protein [Desulfoprunum benzoelyticum]MBB5349765.1 hypothetical protein [Desulfoprunum benzoelyticum]MBM9531901.1 hypothetical protein [Desulfoprunum benzoelyticum]